MCSTSVIFFIIGLPVFIVFTLRWRDSVDFEENSTLTGCTVVGIKTVRKCIGKGGSTTGYEWAYNVHVALCDNKILYRADDNCNGEALQNGTTHSCKVHNDCDSFKWNHDTEANKNSSFIGAGFLAASFLVAVGALIIAVRDRDICFSALPVARTNVKKIKRRRIKKTKDTATENNTITKMDPEPLECV